MPSSVKRILIVDDHPVVRKGLRHMIEPEERLTVCGEAQNAGEVFHHLRESNPDLVLLDLNMGGMSGLELTRQLQQLYPDLLILIVSMHDEMLFAERALCAGARGYMMKRANSRELARAVWHVLDGNLYVSDSVNERLTSAALHPTANEDSPIDRLTDREMEVFLLQGQGLPPRRIAEELCISSKTVEAHRQKIKRKLHLESASELARYAMEWFQSRNGQ